MRLCSEGVWELRCQQCGRKEWEGEPIPLQMHHKNGDPLNNVLSNLELCCANCHGVRHALEVRRKRNEKNTCPDCGLRKRFKGRCRSCAAIKRGLGLHNRKRLQTRICANCDKPLGRKQKVYCSADCMTAARDPAVDPDMLRELVWEMPTTQVAARFGISDVAIAKWCKKYGIEKPPRGYWARVRSKDTPG